MLIDVGIGPRSAAGRLEGTGVSLGDVSAVCLTHLDSDHFKVSWRKTLAKHGIRVFCHASCADALRGSGLADSLIECFDGQAFEGLPGLQVRPIAFEHDESGSHGFVVEGFGGRVGYATDLGRVPEEMIERFEGLDILALESNYDPQMQMNSARPWFLKQRIMGGSGHLSNQQAFGAICQILDRCQKTGTRLPAHIVLLHRSRQCNCPELVRRFFSQDARVAARLVLAEQHERTAWLRIGASGTRIGASGTRIGPQQKLAWG